MIAFGCSIIMPEVYEHCAKAGIERAAEPDSEILAHAASGSIARSFNLLLDTAAARADLEALVVLHEDAEIADDGFCGTLRRALADPEVAIVGCVGATGMRDIAWWDGSPKGSSAPYHYGELGGGQLQWHGASGQVSPPGEVESVYGVMLALSPWAVRNLRFDESLGMLHGYDYDICRQARAAGRKVITAELPIAHHHSLDLVKDIEIWVAAHMRSAEKWETTDPAEMTDDAWKRRARRSEAQAAAARLLAASRLLQADAASQYHARRLEGIRNSRSWRLTEPLRRANQLARTARQRLAQS
jgi:Glycosyltransferase like family